MTDLKKWKHSKVNSYDGTHGQKNSLKNSHLAIVDS